MERIKGKLKVLPYTGRDGNNVCWIARDNRTSTPICRCFGTDSKLGRKRTKAATEHFVDRWNAFEEGGLVGNLVDACEGVRLELNFLLDIVKQVCPTKRRPAVISSVKEWMQQIDKAISEAKEGLK